MPRERRDRARFIARRRASRAHAALRHDTLPRERELPPAHNRERTRANCGAARAKDNPAPAYRASPPSDG